MQATELMKAAIYQGAGGPEVIKIAEVARPKPGSGQLLVRAQATALNRGDVLQRQGELEVPAGQCSIPGVEVAGTVAEIGADVSGLSIGDRVYGVVEGGGFAELCLLDAGMANPIPGCLDYAEAAATAESFLTSNETLFELGGLEPGQQVLIHAGASSIGTTMIRMALHHGAVPICTVGSDAKADAMLELGAAAAINYRSSDFVDEVKSFSHGHGVPLVMDFVGGAYLARNLEVLAHGGCLVVVGLLDGLEAELDLLLLVERRLQIKGSSLRLRPMVEKQAVNARCQRRWQEPLEHGQIKPVVHAQYPLDRLDLAQQEMEANLNIGKIVLTL